MPSQRQLTVEAGLAILLPHLLVVNFVLPWLAQWMPALALDATDPVTMPSFSSLRMTPVGVDFTDPGLWLYLGLVWLWFGGWVYFRQDALRGWGQGLLADSELGE